MTLESLRSQLATAALIGTRRGGRLPEVPATGAGWSPLLARLSAREGEAAERLLDVAACVLALQRAGAKPGAALAPGEAAQVPPAPPEADGVRELPVEIVKIIEQLWQSGQMPRLLSLLEAAASRGLLWPPARLPQLLERATASATLRPLAAKLGGRRMGWLARFHPAWQWAASGEAPTPCTEAPAEGVWKTGTLAARVLWLTGLRQANPAAARALMEGEEFRREPAASRTRLVEAMATGLEPGDAPLLDALLLGDRSGEVREAARLLLRRLPETQLGARMVERVRRWVRVSPQGLDFAPAPIPGDDHAERDGLPLPPKGGITTEHLQAWLETAISCAPLTVWHELTGEAEPAAVLARCQKVASTWRKAAHRGLAQAANHQQNRAWLAALLDHSGMQVQHVFLEPPADVMVAHIVQLCQRALEAKGSLRTLLNVLEQHDDETPPEVCRLIHRVIHESEATSKGRAEELALLKLELMKMTPDALYDELLAGLEVDAANHSVASSFGRVRELRQKLREAKRMIDALLEAPAPALEPGG